MRTVEMKLDNGATMLAEVEDATPSGSEYPTWTGTGASFARQFEFRESFTRIKEPLTTIMETFQGLPIKPSKLNVEFSVKFSGEGGIIFASAKGETGMVVKLEWTPGEQSSS